LPEAEDPNSRRESNRLLLRPLAAEPTCRRRERKGEGKSSVGCNSKLTDRDSPSKPSGSGPGLTSCASGSKAIDNGGF
jgi:hypothetical protein